MSLCLNTDCSNQNSSSANFCQCCGSKLLIQGRYRLIKLISEGSFERTYQAIDENELGSLCVIKQFSPLQKDANILQKTKELFKKEVFILKKLDQHPQIPNLLESFEQKNKLYLVQEFIDGQSLLEELQKRGQFPEDEVNKILIELLPVFNYIHEKQVIHRDVKLENIIRHSNGSLVLIGFGISKQLSDYVLNNLGVTTVNIGYAAPEQMRGMIFNSSDLYSLAVVGIRLLTGCLPLDKNGSMSNELFDINTMQWNWKKRVIVDRYFQKVLDKMLEDIPNKRYQGAKGVLQALNSQLQSSQKGKLVSSNCIDYLNLEKLLSRGNFKDANKETRKKMLEVMGREREGCLRTEDIKKFPSKDLSTIDQLWVKYSNGRFGFSVQKRIYQGLGGTKTYNEKIWNSFGDTVGWRKNRLWLEDNQILFSKTAITGHLPALARRGEFLRSLDDVKSIMYFQEREADMGFYEWDWDEDYNRSIGWDAEIWWCEFLLREEL